ncbi:TPA: hypothetical protein MH395_25735 [Klebsiella pneumoniae]|nr:hypothetical protein D9K86_26285 [Klebsiella pneumoniae]HBX5277945.1 hypothetical protein [Klebsiella pneumoniae]
MAASALPGLRSARPAFNVFTMLTETAGVGGLKTPGDAAAYRGYSAVRFGSPEKAQCAASGAPPCAAGQYQRVSASRRSPGSASQSAASGFSTPLRCPV